MTLESSVKERSGGLTSVRATERKKNAETLKELLTRNAVPALLSENTIKKEGYTWNEVFDDINEYILKETEKFETSKTFDSVTRPLCCSLLHLCVSCSNKGKAYIKCDKIIDACLFILKDVRLTKAFGDAYSSLLFKHVMSCDHYLGYITPTAWEELLNVCLSTCISKHCKLDAYTKMRLLYLVMKNGKNSCQIAIPLRDVLPNLKKCLLGILDDKKMYEVVIEIMILLLETLSPECRLTVCEFAESLLSPILKFYDQNFDQRKKASLFKLLHLTVMLHHPRGALQNETGSHANDWSIWNKQLSSILEIVCVEATNLQKLNKQNDKFLKPSTDYYCLAGSVYFQIFNKAAQAEEAESGSVSKRQRVTFNKIKCFSDFIQELGQCHMPWLEIAHIYIINHSQAISTSDYLLLLGVIENLITNNTNLNWIILEEMTSMIIKSVLSRSDMNSEGDAVLLSLWNSCVRTATMVTVSHKALHAIMQLLLTLDTLMYTNVQPLIKMYFEKGVSVTDDSLKTLTQIFHKFFSKCNDVDTRMKCFAWLTQGQITSLCLANVKQFILRILASENMDFSQPCDGKPEYESLHYILFNSIEKCMLFSEFELEIPNSHVIQEKAAKNIEIHAESNKRVKEYLQEKLLEYIEKDKSRDLDLIDYIKFLSIVLVYCDLILKYSSEQLDRIQDQTVCTLKTALRHMYVSVTNNLKSNTNNDIPERSKLLQCIQEMLMTDYAPLLNSAVRASINEDFFHCINNIIHCEVSTDDEECFYEGENESELNPNVLRHISICLLAAYCRKHEEFRDEILKLILDPTLYNFTISWDINSAFECIELLNHPEVEDPPLESIFTLMQCMCKDLFRNPGPSFKLLKTLVLMLELIWAHDSSMRQNCFIMVKGYLQRCEKSYYPPHVATIIYECAAKIAVLNLENNRDVDNNFLEALLKQIQGDSHIIRVYCCYVLKLAIVHFSEGEIESYLAGLMDIFVVKVSEKKEIVLKDELANRTLTVLHSFFALTQIKSTFVHMIVTEAIQMQKQKSLNERLVKKVLNKITNKVNKQNIDVYLNDNMLTVLNYWFSKNNTIEQLPLHLFGFQHLDAFIEKHVDWLIAADILWRKGGVVKDSDILKHIQTKSRKSVENIIEASICNIMILCLPYVVTEMYKLHYSEPGNAEWNRNAHKMLQSSRQILGDEKWSCLFAANMSEFILLTATHLRDHADAIKLFQVNIPQQTKGCHYPKKVFLGILNYMGALIDGNIMQYLCDNQALVIFKTLFKLWNNVLDENIFEFKVLALHANITFIESIPLGHSSDPFVCNFACNSHIHAIKDARSKKDITVLLKALKIVLQRYLPAKIDMLRKAVSQILSILMIKKEEGFGEECASLLSYLTVDMKDYLKETEDVIDFVSAMSQGAVENTVCPTKMEFLAKLQTYEKSLICPSHETLLNMRQFLKSNKEFVNKLCEEMNTKGFSDDCGTSPVHQIIHALSNNLKSASDKKTLIEACNCLAEIGNYDLKTMVTVPPVKTHKLIGVKPRQYFAIVVMTSLSDVLFDKSPTVTNLAAKTLKRVLKYREGKDALDLEDVDKQMLRPFSSTDGNTLANGNAFADFKISDTKFNSLCASGGWIPNENENHTEWLTRVTVGLMETLASSANYLTTLRAVCVSKPSMCRRILPPLVGLLLDCASEEHVSKISDQLNQFFKHIWDMNFDDKVESSNDSNAYRKTSNVIDQDHKMIVQYMIDIVDFVRLQRNHYKPRRERTVETLNYLGLEYDKVAWAATVADQNVSAIFYGELWAASQNDGVPPASPEATTHLDGGENVQRIYRKCFVSIGEIDALDGCGTAHLKSEDEKRKHLINTGQFSDALLLHDIALSCAGHGDQDLQYGAVKSLHKSGMHHLALQYIKSLPESDELNDIKYECLSFLGDWTDFVDTRDLEKKSKQTNFNSHSVIKAYRYSCLKDCLNLQTTPDFEKKLILPLNRAKLAVARLCQNLNMENCQSVYKVLSKLHLFSDIEDYFSVRCDKLSIQQLLSRWQVVQLPTFHDFKHLEAIISQRSLILEHAAKAFNESLEHIVSLQLQYAELGLSNQRVQMAQRLLAVAKKLHTSHEVALADSQISWAKGHKDIALSLLRNIVSNPPPDVKLTAMSLRQYGMWMAESKCDNTRDIINKYLKRSLEVLRQNDHEETRLKVYDDIAKFADAEYKQVVAYMNSSIFEKKMRCIETMKDTVCSLRATQQSLPLNKDERKALITNDKFGQIDEAEVASTRAEKESFLHLAMRYYLLALKQGEGNNLSVFRVISLWLDNPGLELVDSEQDSFEDLLHAIPSRKYVTALPQLGPRLTNEKTPFAENLRRIIKRCAMEHPHHTLPTLFSLKNSEKDKMILNASENVGGAGGAQRSRAPEPRVAAADALVAELAREHNGMAIIISQMEKMCDATISFANYVPQKKELRQKIPAAERIHKLQDLNAIPIPTDTIPISYHCKYSNLPTLYSFENYFELVGGINCPKKIICRSSDGKNKILLVKGEDDLRQDAMMQQVFNIVNTLLEKNTVTSRNKLLIRTYKVVPMSRRSGVLEWCEGTMPIGLYLIGPNGAHVRYRPKDITHIACRSKMAALHEKRKSNQEKLVAYLKLLKEFRPVFHYFFTEHYLDPVTWYERRLAYTKSVATSSMVGYIMGLGDRHLQNILVDKRTAEVVHIDFGIAFDQAKTLPTPETIPFRLTQDIISGFGSSGVEGIFRRCCEKTMQLLRDNQETLLTILEVLLCDPLYSWTVTSKQQNVSTAPSRDTSVIQTSATDGSLAKRTLLTVGSKLNGTEGGVAGGVAVPGQVARLIHTATDPANLCRLYPGWQPYL